MDLDMEAINAVLAPLDEWAFQCHAASTKLVKSGVLGRSRVARGSCEGVGGQHSWAVLGDDCYDLTATIVDPTRWSYDRYVTGVWVGDGQESYKPHGHGSIWRWGRPEKASYSDEFKLTPSKPWSQAAQDFLALLGPLDLNGWITLAHAPVGGWPSAEIIDAMCETENPSVPGSTLQGYVPIDIVGMLTDRLPIYLSDDR
jgi:hypothetical protein